MHEFSHTSKERLATCHEDLQLIMITAIAISDVDFGIAEGHRSIEKQQQYYAEGKSQIDGVSKKGKHNYEPSLAADIYPWSEGRADWDEETLSYLSGIIHAVSEMLFMDKKITHKVRWGGNWDMDGTIMTDQTFADRPHFELIAVA